MTVAIRSRLPADVETLEAIEQESFATPNWTGQDFLRYDCLIADLNGEIAGFLIFRMVFSGDAAHPAEREILNLAVRHAFRRQGIASALISELLKSSGAVFLEVRESNRAAQNLYRKLGFAEVGRRPNYYHSPDETAIVMNMK